MLLADSVVQEGLRPRRQGRLDQQFLHFLHMVAVLAPFEAGQQPVRLGVAPAQVKRRRQLLLRQGGFTQVDQVIGIVDPQCGIVRVAASAARRYQSSALRCSPSRV